MDEYEIMGALSELSLIDPLRVTRLLMKRVDRQTELQSLDYEALPYPLGPRAPHCSKPPASPGAWRRYGTG